MTKNRGPALRLVSSAPAATRQPTPSRVVHDARGNAVWMGEPISLDGTASLSLALDPAASLEGADPYNRPARTGRRTAVKKRS
jgi:hypothetical protein